MKIIAHFCDMNAIKRLIPNLFTAGNLIGGILAIIFTLTGRITWAPYCIFVSALFDFLDGFMARLLKVPSELGKQLDSLADMVTFGVAPGLIVFSILGFDQGQLNLLSMGSYTARRDSILIQLLGVDSFLAHNLAYIAFLIPVFALFRLAKFNLDTRQTDSFIGLPTPAMTLFFAVFPILVFAPMGWTGWSTFTLNRSFILNPDFLVLSTLVFSILMVSEIPLFALKFKHFKWRGNEIRYLFLITALALLIILFFWAIPLIIILYVILSLINTRLVKPKEK